MDEYKQIHTFDLVYLSDVDLDTYKVYDTIWAYKIKLDGTSDRKLDKLNPRWCLVGTPMDRDMYKSHAETLRMWMFKIILAIKAAHYKKLLAFAFDLKNAFQSTRTDFDKQSGKPTGQPPLYCTQAPGFEQRGPKGEKMVCKVNVGLQGRIDASLLTSTNIWKLVKKLGFVRMLADSQAFVYHNGPMVGKDVSLSEIINSFKATEDSSGQQPPKAWGVFGLHVDDGFGVATGVMDPERNRLVQYLRGGIAIEYAITMTGWRKQLGFIITCDDKEETVSLSAPGPLAELADKVLDGVGRYAPKHIMTAEMESLAPGVVPPIGDPSRGSYLQDQELCRSALGALIWLCNAYPQRNEAAIHASHRATLLLITCVASHSNHHCFVRYVLQGRDARRAKPLAIQLRSLCCSGSRRSQMQGDSGWPMLNHRLQRGKETGVAKEKGGGKGKG